MKSKKISPKLLSHFNYAKILYAAEGQSAVYSYANKEGITDWRYCKACDCDSPCVAEMCLVCGQELTDVPHSAEANDKESENLELEFQVGNKEIVFSAHKRLDPNYPGIDIKINGVLIAIVEYTSTDNAIRTIAYTEDDDEPKTITNFKEFK